jgi:hypothetical protein
VPEVGIYLRLTKGGQHETLKVHHVSQNPEWSEAPSAQGMSAPVTNQLFACRKPASPQKTTCGCWGGWG